jgi:hypothetical protein
MRAFRPSLSAAIALALMIGILGWAAPAEAYRMIQNTTVGRVSAGNLVTCNDPGGFTHWGTANIPWRLNTAGQGSGKATALQNATAAWTNVTSADHNLTYAGTTTTGWSTNGVNTVLWASGNGCTGGCLALTALVLQSGQVIVESDITFNSSYTWNTNGSDYDTQAVLTHELGHALGIHHTELTSTPRPTMYAYYFGTDGRTLETDDRSALQCSQTKYPPSGGGTGGAPATPASLNVQPDFCLGWVSLDWSASSGATSYELQQASNSSYTGAFTIYSGSNTSYFTNGSGTRWFRVRACNSSGCSGWRNGNRSAPYYDICL